MRHDVKRHHAHTTSDERHAPDIGASCGRGGVLLEGTLSTSPTIRTIARIGAPVMTDTECFGPTPENSNEPKVQPIDIVPTRKIRNQRRLAVPAW